MNKIKKLFAVLLSIVCAFALFACSTGANGHYVEDSLSATISYYSNLKEVIAFVYFDVYLPKTGKYDIEYTLELYYNGNIIAYEEFSTSETSDGEYTANIHKYWDVYNVSSFSVNNSEIRVTDVTAKLSEGGSDVDYPTHYSGIAIGFGVAGAAVLGAIIALFVVFKKREGSVE